MREKAIMVFTALIIIVFWNGKFMMVDYFVCQCKIQKSNPLLQISVGIS